MDVLGDLVDVLGRFGGCFGKGFGGCFGRFGGCFGKFHLIILVCLTIWWMFWENSLLKSITTELFGGCFGKLFYSDCLPGYLVAFWGMNDERFDNLWQRF